MATDIKTEITRIKQAKSDIRSVIESKGVEVDPRATIDKYASYIKNIGDIELIDVEFTSNGDYTAPSGQAYQNVTVDVTATPTLQNKTITSNGIYTADQGYDGLGTVTVDVQPGGGESYIMAYYVKNPYDYYNNTDAWGGRITNSLTNVIEQWIDGVQVTPMTETYQFSMNIVHTVKFVFDPQHNETVANMFGYDYGVKPTCVDWSHFTGTINYSGTVNYSELLPNITKPTPLLNLEPKIIQQNTTDLTNVTVGIGNSSHACVVYNHPTLASYDNKIIYNKLNNQIIKYYASVYEFLYVPEFLSNGAVIDTTALGGAIERYYMNDNIDELHTATNGGSMIFTGTTPPDVIDFANEMWDATTICVPNSSQQAYYDTILNTSTYKDMSKFDIRPVCHFKCEYNWTATQYQERGTFYVANRGWPNFNIVKLYDAQDNLVAEVADGGMMFNPSDVPAYGTYRAELYCRNYDGSEFPDIQSNTDAVVIDASDVYYTRVGDWRLCRLNYLEELIMPESVTDLSTGFLWNCPKITKVTLLSQSVPTINTDNAFLADEGATRPCPDVIVNDVAAYRADANWSYLEQDGRINLVQA